ncbi:MAG: PqqD family protein [Bacteroidaceae bacterium]|nr:PqqD family protein [Bacteroidaceae bacterium]
MKIKGNYKLREIAGETIVVNQGMTNVNMTRIISLNSSARLLYEGLTGKEFSLEDAADILVETYGIGKEQALKDAKVWVESLQQCGVIE